MNPLIKFLSKNSTTLLSVVSSAGVVLTAISASKATIKMKEDYDVENPQTTMDKIKFALPYYIRPIIVGGTTIAMILGSNYIDRKRQLALAAALSLSSEQLKLLDDKTKELVGEEKYDEIKKEITKEKIKKTPHKNLDLPKGMFEVFEPYSRQYITTSNERLAFAMLNANENMAKKFCCKLNDIIRSLGGKPDPEVELMGWHMENAIQDYNWGYTGGAWIGLSTYIDDVEGQEVIVLDYDVQPVEQIPENMVWYDPKAKHPQQVVDW